MAKIDLADKAKLPNNKTEKTSDMIKIKIMKLDDSQLSFETHIKKSDKGSVLFKLFCDHLTNETSDSLLEHDYFGLRYTDQYEKRQWLDLDKNVLKQLKHKHNNKTFGLSFRAKHYPESPLIDLTQNITKYLFYLQIRRDLAQGRLLCPEDKAHIIGGLILQAELGNSPYKSLEDFEAVLLENDENNNTIVKTDNNSSNISPTINSFYSPGSSVSKSSVDIKNDPRLKYFGKLRILLNQTDAMSLEMAKYHIQLHDLSTSEMECEILANVCMWPTYGIDPYKVEPLFDMENLTQTASTQPIQNVNKDDVKQKNTIVPTLALTTNVHKTSNTKSPSVYLGLKHNGITSFIGIKRNELYLWNDITKMRCDGAKFIMNIKPKAEKAKGKKIAFKCESKAAAFSLWQWANDRKCFFTLKKASDAKVEKSSNRFFSRSKSFRFTGKPQAEMKDKVSVHGSNVPQPHFTRAASLRRYNVEEATATSKFAHATLPARIKGGIPRKPIQPIDDDSKDKIDSIQETTDKFLTENTKEDLIQPLVVQQTNKSPKVNGVLPNSYEKTDVDQSKDYQEALTKLNNALENHDLKITNGYTKSTTLSSNNDHDDNEKKFRRKLLTMAIATALLAIFFIVMESKPTNNKNANDKMMLKSYFESINSIAIVRKFGLNIYDPIKDSIIAVTRSFLSIFIS